MSALTARAHLEPRKASDLGAIRNVFHILSDDRLHFRPKALISAAGLAPGRFAEAFKVPRTYAYKDEVKLSPKLKKAIVDLVMATDLAFELLGANLEETKAWIVSPNSLFFGASPFEVCMRGDGHELIIWLNERMGRKPGPAF